MATFDELNKYFDEYEANPQQQQLGVNFNAPEQGAMPQQEETPYQRMMRERYGTPEMQAQQAQDADREGILNNILNGFTSGAAGVFGGIAGIPGQNAVSNYFDEVTERNAPIRQHDKAFESLSNFGDFLTDPSGAVYTVANQLGSMAALSPAAALVPEGLVGAGAAKVAHVLGKTAGRPAINWLMTQGGRNALRMGVRGAATAVPESLSEWGSASAELDRQGDPNHMANSFEVFAKNMAMLPVSNGLEYMLLGKSIFHPKGEVGESLLKRIAMSPLRATPEATASAVQNGIEELYQQTASDQATGKEVGSMFDPESWTPSQRDAFEKGAFGSFILGMGSNTAGNLRGVNQEQADAAAPNNPAEPPADQPTRQFTVEPRIANQVTNDQFSDAVNVAMNDTSANPVDRMRNLQGHITYGAKDGTNCARTIGLAMVGTDYQDLINVDNFIEVAQNKGQLKDPANYVPKPGDLAVVNDGNHIVMVSDNGGTIQNGSSANGVYESELSPQQMFGNVKYYISTSELSGGSATGGMAQGQGLAQQQAEESQEDPVAKARQETIDNVDEVLGKKSQRQAEEEQRLAEAEQRVAEEREAAAQYRAQNASEFAPINSYQDAFSPEELAGLNDRQRSYIANNFAAFAEKNKSRTLAESRGYLRELYNRAIALQQQANAGMQTGQNQMNQFGSAEETQVNGMPVAPSAPAAGTAANPAATASNAAANPAAAAPAGSTSQTANGRRVFTEAEQNEYKQRLAEINQGREDLVASFQKNGPFVGATSAGPVKINSIAEIDKLIQDQKRQAAEEIFAKRNQTQQGAPAVGSPAGSNATAANGANVTAAAPAANPAAAPGGQAKLKAASEAFSEDEWNGMNEFVRKKVRDYVSHGNQTKKNGKLHNANYYNANREEQIQMVRAARDKAVEDFNKLVDMARRANSGDAEAAANFNKVNQKVQSQVLKHLNSESEGAQNVSKEQESAVVQKSPAESSGDQDVNAKLEEGKRQENKNGEGTENQNQTEVKNNTVPNIVKQFKEVIAKAKDAQEAAIKAAEANRLLDSAAKANQATKEDVAAAKDAIGKQLAEKTAESKGNQAKAQKQQAQQSQELQPLTGKIREVIMERLNHALGKGNVQILDNDAFVDKLEEAYREGSSAEEARRAVEPFRNGNNVVYGFAHNGKIYLNGDVMNANTPAHEFSHIWAKVAQKVDGGKLWKEGVELLKQTDMWQEVSNDPLYQNLKNEDAIASEVLARIVGQNNEEYVNKLSKGKDSGLMQRIYRWLDKMFKEVRDLLWFPDAAGRKLTYEEFVNMPLKSLWKQDASRHFREEYNKTLGGNQVEAMAKKKAAAETTVENGVDVDKILSSDFSVRNPWNKGVTENANLDLLLSNAEAALKDPDYVARIVAAVRDKVPGFGYLSKDPDVAVKQLIGHMKSNILYMYEKMDPETRERAKKWYDGGRLVAEEWADRYGISPQAAAGSIAVLSPQKDWFTNMTLDERILDCVFGHADEMWTDEMSLWAHGHVGQFEKQVRVKEEEDAKKAREKRNRLHRKLGEPTEKAPVIYETVQYSEYVPPIVSDSEKNQASLKRAKGKTLQQLLDEGDIEAAAVWVKCYDKAHNPRSYRIITPEGGTGDYVRNSDGSESGAAWGDFGAIEKAISIAVEGSHMNIFYNLGDEHKVKNFANNINHPESENFATIDTHAAGVAAMLPTSASSEIAQQNFGAGSSSSGDVGLSGLYPLILEAYRQAANEKKILPREMQSITWEGVRVLYPDHTKRPNTKKGETETIEQRLCREIMEKASDAIKKAKSQKGVDRIIAEAQERAFNVGMNSDAIRDIWSEAKEKAGKTENKKEKEKILAEALKTIYNDYVNVKEDKMLPLPAWAGTPQNAKVGDTYDRSGVTIPKTKKSASGKDTDFTVGVKFDASKFGKDFVESLKAMSPEEREKTLSEAFDLVASRVLAEYGITGKVVSALYGNEEGVGAGFVVDVSKAPQQLVPIAKMLGHTTRSESVVAISPQRVQGTSEGNTISVKLPGGWGAKEIAEFGKKLESITDTNGKPAVRVHSTSGGTTTVVNTSDMTTEKLLEKIKKIAPGFDMSSSGVYSAIIPKEKFGFLDEKPTTDAKNEEAKQDGAGPDAKNQTGTYDERANYIGSQFAEKLRGKPGEKKRSDVPETMARVGRRNGPGNQRAKTQVSEGVLGGKKEGTGVQRTGNSGLNEAPEATARPAKTTRQVNFEIAPDPDNKVYSEAWAGKSTEEQQKISDEMAPKYARKVLKKLGLPEDSLKEQIGGFEGKTNPSYYLDVDEDKALDAANLLGYVTRQKSMLVVSSDKVEGWEEKGLITVNLPEGWGEKEVSNLYDKLYTIKDLTGNHLVGGHSTRGRKMEIINFSDTPTEEVADKIRNLISGFKVDLGIVYAAYPSKDNYGFAETKEDVKEGVVYDEGANLLREQFTEELEDKLGIAKGSGVPGTEKSLGSGDRSDAEGRETSESARLQGEDQGRNESSERGLEAKEAAKLYDEAAENFPEVKDKAVSEKVKDGIRQTVDFGKREGDILDSASGNHVRQGVSEVQDGSRPALHSLGEQTGGMPLYSEKGFSLTRKLINEGYADLTGQKVESISDLAEIAQVLRHPGYEKMHYVYVKDGKVVYHETVTSGLPATVKARYKNEREREYEARMRENLRRVGADTFYLLHNHPDGDVKPSTADFNLTDFHKSNVEQSGVKFGGHIILDTTECNVLTDGKTESRLSIPEHAQIHYDAKADVPNILLGTKLGPAEALVEISKKLADQSKTTVFFTDTSDKVRSIIQLPEEFMQMDDRQMMRYLRWAAKKEYGTWAYIVTSDQDAYKKMLPLYRQGSGVYDILLTSNPETAKGQGQYRYSGGFRFYDFFAQEDDMATAHKVLGEGVNKEQVQGTQGDEGASSMPELQASVAESTDPEIQRSVDEVVDEIKKAFPSAKTVARDGQYLMFTMPNGSRIAVDVANQIAIPEEEAAKAREAHGRNANEPIRVNGYTKTFGKDAAITLSQTGDKGTAFHEVFHTAWNLVLNPKEKAAMRKYFKDKTKGKSIDEAMADAYRDWQLARQRHQGSMFGKLFQKIQDFAKKMQAILTETENVHNVMRKVAEGEVWNREARNNKAKTDYLVTNESITGNTKVPVIDISNMVRTDTTDAKARASIAKSLYGKTFKIIGSEGIGFVKPNEHVVINGEKKMKHPGDHLIRGTGNMYTPGLTNEVRQKAATAVEQLLGSAIYIDKHLDQAHGTQSRWIDLYAAVRNGDKIYPIHLQAKEKDPGSDEFTVGKAMYYNLTNEEALPSTGKHQVLPKGKGKTSSTISVANLLQNVKDGKGRPYVTNGELNYDPGVTLETQIHIKDGTYVRDGPGYKAGDTINFIDEILEGRKKSETRENKYLPRGWVGLSRDGHTVVGRVLLGDPKPLVKNSKEYNESKIKDTNYDIDKKDKYYYPVLDIQDFRDNPRPIRRGGVSGKYRLEKTDKAVSAGPELQAKSSGAQYSISSAIDTGFKKAEQYVNRNVRTANTNTAEGRTSQIYANTGTKTKSQSILGYLKEFKDKFYREWVDKNHALHYVDDFIEKTSGKKLSMGEKIYYRAQVMRALANGAATTLIEGNEGSMNALRERIGKDVNPKDKAAVARAKELRAKFKNVTMRDVLETIPNKTMDSKYPDYLKKHGINSWREAFSNYIGARRLLELLRLVEDKSLQHITHSQKEFTDFIDKHPQYAKFRPKAFGGKWREQVQAMARKDPALAAQMAKELAKEYKLPKGISRADLEATVNNAPKEFNDAAQKFYQLQENLLILMEDGHLISQTVHDKINSMYKEYCPLVIDYSDTAPLDAQLEGFISRDGTGITNVGSMLKHVLALGSEHGLKSPLESTYNSIQMLTNRAERNKVGVHFVRMVENNPALAKSGLLERLPKKSADAKNCEFTVMENGEKVVYKTTPDMYGPIVGYDEESAGIAFNVAANTANVLRAGATMSPSFIFRNLIRDTIFAAVSSRNGFVPLIDSYKGMMAYLHDKELRGEFDAMGVTSYNFFGSTDNMVKSMDELMHEAKIDGPISFLKWLAEHFQEASEVVEASTRMGEYMKARKNGKSMEEAALDARDVTLDFSRSGVSGQKYNRIVPFFNAAIQGGDKMIRLVADKDTRAQTLRMLATRIILPSLFLWALNHDEPWYEELDPDIKNSYWILPGGKIRIPKPQEAGVVFGSGAEAIMDQLAKKDPVAMKNWAKAFRDVALPNMIPTIGLPLLEWWTNYSLFREKPIEGNRLKRLPVEQRYNSGTSELSKFIGDKAGLSPVKLDNTVRGYAGTMGMFAWQLPDSFVESKRNLPSKKFIERTFVRDLFINDMNMNRTQEDFYDLVEKAQQQHAGYGKKGKPTAEVKAVSKAMRDVSKVNKDIQEIMNSKTLNSDQKRQLIDNKRKVLHTIQKATINRYGSKFE